MKRKNADCPVSLQGVLCAEAIVYRSIQPTPLTYYKSLSDFIGTEVRVKHENHLPGGSFKIRGGLNVMNHLKQQGVTGVITFSTGNHGISIATAAKMAGIDATIVLPKGNNQEKNRRILDAEAHLIEAGDNFEQAAQECMRIQREKGLYYIHAANEPHLIHGVGTGFLEILRELPDIDAIFLPIGGGSELAAAVTVFKALKPSVEIYAVQAELSKGAYLSWREGRITPSSNHTFAGGIATGSAYELPFLIYKDHLTDFILLSEEEIKEAIYLALLHTHNLAEGAGAATLMAAKKICHRLKGKKVVLQMSGCNEPMSSLQDILNSFSMCPKQVG